MGVYESLGARPFINVSCATATRWGGVLMEQETLDAMTEAAKESVHLDELQAAASKIIAEKTHAEAGIVTCGAAAALTLGTAACITGFNVAHMNRLPDTTGIPNEVIMAQHQISGYNHSIVAAGAKLIGVGIPNDTTPPGKEHVPTIYDFESAIAEHTVAIAYASRLGNNPPLEQVITLGKKYHIPVMLDAANELPPVENLYKFIDMGADLVAFSGGKCIRGPQASGILCGRRDLIAAAILQNLDMGGAPFDKWEPPSSLIPKEKLCSKPTHGVGRGMKVTKEIIVGLLTALQKFTEKPVREMERLQSLLEDIAAPLHGVAGAELKISGNSHENHIRYPMLEVKLDESKVGRSAAEVSQRLKNGAPSIHTVEQYLNKGVLLVDSTNLTEETAKIVSQRLYMEITKK